jgi:hypothetical protein
MLASQVTVSIHVTAPWANATAQAIEVKVRGGHHDTDNAYLSTAEWVGLTFLTALCCLIFKDHNHIHGWRSRQLKVIVSTLRRGQSAGLSGYPTSEGDYRDFQFVV